VLVSGYEQRIVAGRERDEVIVGRICRAGRRSLDILGEDR
jgi:hypothetical protein